MPHTVWNLGSLSTSQRLQPRRFVAGIEPARNVVIGRRREPKQMLVLLDAWAEVVDLSFATSADFHSAKYSLALGKDPLSDAKLVPVARFFTQGLDAGVGATDQPATGTPTGFERLFKAQGTMWAAKYVAIDFQETGTMNVSDVDIHLDWDVTQTDWWTWFISWNDLEASPDGGLVDGDRSYA